MGNSMLTQQASSQILAKQWQQYGPEVYCNKATNEIIKQRRLTFSSQDEMKYVFNCLLKRMHNYNPNVLKVVYLRKLNEQSSICDCGKKFVILVYIEKVEFRLRDFIGAKENLRAKILQFLPNSSEHKCVCLQVLKGARYLKDRYGSFKVTSSNCWIQISQSKNQNGHSFSVDNQNQYAKNPKLKLWISSEEEQNFPDESCQQKQMCLSIVQLIQHVLIPSKLCKCYKSTEALDEYFSVNCLKQLVKRIRQDNQKVRFSQFAENISQPQKIAQPQPAFQRNGRSFSSIQQGHHAFQHQGTYQVVKNHYYHCPNERKYTLTETARQPIQSQVTISDKKHVQTPLMHSNMIQNLSDGHKIFGNSHYQGKHTSLQYIKNGYFPQKNEVKTTKFVQSQLIPHSNKQYNSLNNNGGCQIINHTIKYSHTINPYHIPIIGIAEMSAQSNSPPVLIMPNHNQTTFNNHRKLYTVNQLPTDRKNLIKDQSHEQSLAIPQISKIQLESNVGKGQAQMSLDKGTNPTDRTKFEISSKGQEKKQRSAIDTSRKKISIVPISLYSTYGASSSLKPKLDSYDNIPRQPQTAVGMQLQIGEKNQPNSNKVELKPKKESASSSRSEHYYPSYQANSSNPGKKQEKTKFVPKKRMERQLESVLKRSGEKKAEQSEKKTQKFPFFAKKIQTLMVSWPKGDSDKLRQSHYVVAAQNSLVDSRQKAGQEHKKMSEKELFVKLTSLIKMSGEVPVINPIKQVEVLEPRRSQRQSEALEQIAVQSPSIQNQRPRQSQADSSAPSNLSRQTNQPRLIVETQMQKARAKLLLNSNHSPNQRARVPTQHLQNILSEKVSSLIVRQNEEPVHSQEAHQQEYRIKIWPDQNVRTVKIHQKHLSNPIYDKKYNKNNALKQEFSNLLDFHEQNSFETLSQNNVKSLAMTQNQLKETQTIQKQSQCNTSQHISIKKNQIRIDISQDSPPVPHKQSKQFSNPIKWRKPLSKNEVQKQQIDKDNCSKNGQKNQKILRLTQSGIEDNSIKQKVRTKKAQFAELKNQMNSLLL